MDLASLVEALEPVAREAGRKIMAVYAMAPEVESKSDGSPVTQADRAAEAMILSALAGIAPDIPVVSEENAASHALRAPERFFLVDPLDGTREFVKRDGKGAFTVNIALIEQGIPVAGVVHAPALDRTFVGASGHDAIEARGDARRSITVRAVPGDGPVAVMSASHRDSETSAWLRAQDVREIVSIGSSLKFCLIAAGEADVYPRFGTTMEWDTAAGDAVLRAAGGEVRSPGGQVIRYGKPAYRNGAFIAWGRVRG